nr:DUF2760 domain-containing protein [Luteolibacter marinus]
MILGIAAAVFALLTAGLAFIPAQTTAAPTPAAPAPAAAPPPPAPTAHPAEAEVIAFVGLLQEKGRFVDFLMEDITPYDDSQVAAASRVVHQGCAAVLKEHFDIAPVAGSAEGEPITLPAGYAADEYRLLGKISGEPPFTGTLVHKGWKTGTVKLPRILKADGDRLPAIAPAEVELK